MSWQPSLPTPEFLDPEGKLPAPPICMVLLTYQRTGMASRTIQGVADNLIYPKALRSWYIADDGSEPAHVGKLLNLIEDNHELLHGYHTQKFRPGTTFCGEGWNMAVHRGHQAAEILLWLEDDWELTTKLDIKPYVRMLLERSDVGIVRLGHMAVNSEVRIVGHNGIHYLEYMRTTAYAYAGNPLLRHMRYAQFYGIFDTEANPGDVELHYDQKYREMRNGPAIWRPAGLEPWGVFGHIGQERTW